MPPCDMLPTAKQPGYTPSRVMGVMRLSAVWWRVVALEWAECQNRARRTISELRLSGSGGADALIERTGVWANGEV